MFTDDKYQSKFYDDVRYIKDLGDVIYYIGIRSGDLDLPEDGHDVIIKLRAIGVAISRLSVNILKEIDPKA